MDTSLAPVLHVIPGLRTGGAEQMLATLVTARRQQPFSQVVVDLLSGGSHAERIRKADIPVYELSAQSPLALPFVVFRLAALIARLKPVAIQSWLYYADLTALWALELSGRRAATRLYWGVRSSELETEHYRRTLAWTIKACANRSTRPDAVVANSFAGRDAHRQFGFAPRAFPVIANGIDTARFRPDPTIRLRMRSELGVANDHPLVIHVARVDPMKDHASLLAVASLLPNVNFLTAGFGTQSLGTTPNLRALGLRRDLPNLYAAADVVLSTSIFGEGFSNVIAEAMACGVPAVATDVGDSRRIVGDTGAIVVPRDVEAMASKINALLMEKNTSRHERSNAARQRIQENFSLDRMVSTFDALHVHGTLPVNNGESAFHTKPEAIITAGNGTR